MFIQSNETQWHLWSQSLPPGQQTDTETETTSEEKTGTGHTSELKEKTYTEQIWHRGWLSGTCSSDFQQCFSMLHIILCHLKSGTTIAYSMGPDLSWTYPCHRGHLSRDCAIPQSLGGDRCVCVRVSHRRHTDVLWVLLPGWWTWRLGRGGPVSAALQRRLKQDATALPLARLQKSIHHTRGTPVHERLKDKHKHKHTVNWRNIRKLGYSINIWLLGVFKWNHKSIYLENIYKYISKFFFFFALKQMFPDNLYVCLTVTGPCCANL